MDDPNAAEVALVGLGVKSGLDSTEAGMEGLFQAMTGTGYDLGCDGAYDVRADVPPFLVSPTDPFGGTSNAAWPDATAGALGGMGFREGAVHVVLFATETMMRDAEVDPTPGGCPGDAGRTEVLTAAAALDAWLIGGYTALDSPTLKAQTQVTELVRDAGSLADLDGDGVEEPLTLDLTGYEAPPMQADVDARLAAIAAKAGVFVRYEAVAFEDDDPTGMVSRFDPSGFTDVDPRVTPTLEVTVHLRGVVPSGPEPQRFELPVRVLDGDTVLDATTVVVWVP